MTVQRSSTPDRRTLSVILSWHTVPSLPRQSVCAGSPAPAQPRSVVILRAPHNPPRKIECARGTGRRSPCRVPSAGGSPGGGRIRAAGATHLPRLGHHDALERVAPPAAIEGRCSRRSWTDSPIPQCARLPTGTPKLASPAPHGGSSAPQPLFWPGDAPSEPRSRLWEHQPVA